MVSRIEVDFGDVPRNLIILTVSDPNLRVIKRQGNGIIVCRWAIMAFMLCLFSLLVSVSVSLWASVSVSVNAL